MKTCVISPGVVHAVPRTVATAPYLDEVHFVDMTGTADRASLEQARIRYHRPSEGGSSSLAGRNLQALLARLAPDVIVCHYGSGDHFFNAVAYGRCPIAVVAMGNDVLYEDGDTRVSPLRRLLTRMGLRCAGLVSAKSKFIAEATRQLGYDGPLEINYWGSDLRRFCMRDAEEARAELGLAPGAEIVLSPRAIEPRLNIHLIVDAFARVASRRPRAELVVLGRSMPHYLATVSDRIAALGLSGRVRVLGEMSQEDLPAWYQASDVVVSMASVEGFPNTVLEVMACGVPLLAGDIEQIRELLTDGTNARICAIDVTAIAGGVEDMLTNRARALVVAARGRETALQAGDIDANGRRFAAGLRKLAGSGRRPPALALLRFRSVLLAYLVARRWLPDAD